MQQLIQQSLTAIIPIAGTLLPGLLKQDKYPDWLNALISAIIVLLAAIGTAYVQGQIGTNFVQTVSGMYVIISILLLGPLKPLDEFLTKSIPAQIESTLPPPPIVQQPKIPGPDSTHQGSM